MKRRASCNEGLHTYGHRGSVGGGITRRSCTDCGAVQLELRDPDALADSGLFGTPSRRSMFYLEVVLNNFETPSSGGRRFGQRPDARRRAATAVA